jgi:integrase
MTTQPIENGAQCAALGGAGLAGMVRQMLADGVLTPEALGLGGGTPSAVVVGARGSGERVTVAELATRALDSCSKNTRRTYGSYMRLLANGEPTVAGPDGKPYEGIGDMWADEVLPSHLEAALKVVWARAQAGGEDRADRRESKDRVVRESDGSGAAYNAVGAWRKMFTVAVNERHLAENFNPASKVDKPARQPGRRLAIREAHLREMLEFFGSTGDDPELDLMINRFILITGARQEGVLNLKFGGLDPDECTVRLDEKFGKVVFQPVPDWFLTELRAFALARGSSRRKDPVFVKRLASGGFKAITRRRFNSMFGDRLQAACPWADKAQVTAHTLRHHAVTVIERATSRAVATAFARHKPEGTNGIYTQASPEEVAEAVVLVYGGDHPWLHRSDIDGP